MTQTLRRELRLKFGEVCNKYLHDYSMPFSVAEQFIGELADAALSIRGISVVEEKPQERKPDLVDGILAMRDAPGIKREAKIDAILSYIGGKLQINTETARWKKFAKFAYNKHLDGEQIETFISWVTSQKNFDVQFWPPQKMEEMWPQAFGEKKPAEKPSMFRTINS